ncbi:YecA family protein [Haloplasma contractile]|uniref:Protein translocase subunit SecA n=1 Tax=Haloplasma contractile SSD-17B TaxID=1033810 RepID=U2FIL8_9MOLU|nr:SEC-C metal-binding domain-containing protein [Haloplasma contractile]ERJ11079.1 Protein translocase subunit SecA [Haloplasma contractile SSD-17B]
MTQPADVTNYIIAFVHLYGILHKQEAIEFYNMLNDEPLEGLIEIDEERLNEKFVVEYGDYFVEESIAEFEGDFEEIMEQKVGKPYYIPPKEELFNYIDSFYYEKPKQYDDLLNYVATAFYDGDKDQADFITEDIMGFCRYDFKMNSILDVFERQGIKFEDAEQVKEVTHLITELRNHTRIWEHNGHTAVEIAESEALQKKSDPIRKSKKIGRNEPCPCGSGNKYNKCCL